MNQLSQEFGGKLAESIGHGYKYIKSKYSLVKTMENGTKSIIIDLTPTTEKNIFKLAMYAHIRLDELEDLYGDYHLYLSKNEKKTHPTLVKNCDDLYSKNIFAMSFKLDSDNLDEIVTRYAEEIRGEVLPFLDKFYSVDTLVASFEQENPIDWVSSDRITRNLILLSAYASRSDWVAYKKIATQFIEYCSKPHALAFRDLAKSVINGLEKSLTSSGQTKMSD